MTRYAKDPAKEKKNITKHRISLNEGESVLEGGDYLYTYDKKSSAEKFEDRYVAVGRSEKNRIVLVVFSFKKDEAGVEYTRIISARELDPQEKKSFATRRIIGRFRFQ